MLKTSRRSFSELNKGRERNVAELFGMREAKVEGRGISRGEVCTGIGKYEKVMFLNFSEAGVDRVCGANWWMTPSGLIVIEESCSVCLFPQTGSALVPPSIHHFGSKQCKPGR